MFFVDTGRNKNRERGVLALYGGDAPALELRLKRMVRTPPYRQPERRSDLLETLQQLHVPRLNGGVELLDQRPNVQLEQLTQNRLKAILKTVDRWIDDVRGAATEPEEESDSGGGGAQ